jgi:hypothetical protein
MRLTPDTGSLFKELFLPEYDFARFFAQEALFGFADGRRDSPLRLQLASDSYLGV